MKPVLVIAALAASPAGAVEVQFCWLGAAGYSLAGTMAFPDPLATADRITEADVTGFKMTGYRDGVPVGSWSLDKLTGGTDWNLNFSPREMRFMTGGYSDSDTGQQWNASGEMTDCGTPGLGFNAGGGAQDLCLDGVFVVESGVAPETPLLAYPAGSAPICTATVHLSLSAD